MKNLAISIAAIALASCVQAEEYAAAAEAAAKQANNISVGILEEAPCAMSLGAWARLDNRRKRMGAFYMCVPDADLFGVDVVLGS